MILHKISNKIINIFKDTNYCPLCGNYTHFSSMTNEIETRKNALCPICGSLERHRFLYYIYNLYFLNTSKKIKILHFAPEYSLYKLISTIDNIEYLTMDLNPEKYPFASNIIKGDIKDINIDDNEFDFVLHNQVLEHIKDEKKCIDECLRITKKSGKCIVNIPYSPKILKNYEDANINTKEERLRYYYQSDHERLYGKELLQKYENNYSLYRIDEHIFPKFMEKKLQLKRESKFFQDAYYVINKS